MGTEILKEQYNLLLNDQKSKLLKLKQKKQQKLDNDSKMIGSKIKNNDDSDLDINDDVFSKFDKLESMDSESDNECIKKKTIAAQTSKNEKIIVKKNLTKKNDKPKNGLTTSGNNGLGGESESIADKLRELKDENGRFRKLLAEKDYEINYLKKKTDNEQIVQGLGPISGDAAATKIVDLAKKVRELTASLEIEKTKNKQMAKNNKDLESQLVKAKEKKKEYFENDDDNDFSDDEQVQAKISLSKENKELKEKLNQTSHKMMEFKSQSECLKQDVNKYKKALEKEIGDNVDIKTVLSGNSNWKGRNMQIRTLQNKVKELKEQLGSMDSRASQMLDDEDLTLDESNFMKVPQSAQYSNYTFNSISTTRTNADSRQKMELKKIEKERREQFEKLKHESEALNEEVNSMNKKLDASKTRNNVLANENKNFREQIKVMIEKGKHDNELIDALMKKQAQLKYQLDNLSQEKEKTTKAVEDKSKESQIKAMQENNTINQLKAIIAEREKRVKSLESELESQRQNAGSALTGSEFFLNSAPKTDQNTDVSFNDPEPIRNRTPSVSNSFQRNVVGNLSFNDRENTSRASLRGSAGQRPPSSNALNAKLLDQKKEQSKDYKLEISELTTLHKTSEIERVRLVELVKTLQKRIEDLNDKSMENENKLNEQRRKCAGLEKQIEKIKLQEPKTVTKQKSLVNQQSNVSAQMDQYKMEELETSLLIQKDENDALKAALKSTLEAKEEDLRLYVEMLESTKRVFLDGLKQYKQTALE